jgi:hypothetical protein
VKYEVKYPSLDTGEDIFNFLECWIRELSTRGDCREPKLIILPPHLISPLLTYLGMVTGLTCFNTDQGKLNGLDSLFGLKIFGSSYATEIEIF